MADLQPVYLIVGGDRPKIARAVDRLRSRVGEGSIEHLSARDASAADVIAACNAMGLFGGDERLVLVDEVERWKAPEVKELAAYLADPAPGTVVALTGDLRADSPLGKAVAKAGKVLVYDVTKKALPGWVAQQFERHGATADAEACRTLVELVGDDLEELATEADKIATWAGGEPITGRHVEALAAGRAETSVFALTDAWGRRDPAAALAACESLLERSEKARRDEVPRLAAMLTSHVGKVRACQALAAEGLAPREAAPRLKMHPFAAEKAFRQAENFGVDELRDVTVRLAGLDHALKGGSRLSGDLELQRALLEISRPAEPATRER